MQHWTVAWQTAGLAILIIIALGFLIVGYVILAYYISVLRAHRREKYLAKKFFNNIEEYRRDFS